MMEQLAANTELTAASEAELEAAGEIGRSREQILNEVNKVIVGQEKVIELLLISLFSRGHCLFVGVPGLAKTLLVSTLSEVLNLSFSRIQFTPDLMPADITGTDILEDDAATGKRKFNFIKGPIFANLLLADEINRTSPKTQAALLQAMQEHRVTTGGHTYVLDPPFLVMATQNPIEQEGTYPLPEAQLDRFMFQIDVDYPDFDEEMEIVRATTSSYLAEPKKILSAERVVALQDLVRKVPASDHVVKYAVALARNSRSRQNETPEYVKKWVAWGAGPRASQYLIIGAKARALIHGRHAASCDDVRAIAPSVLKHRIITNFHAEAEGIGPDRIIAQLLESVPEDAPAR
ncbi:MAG TPA: MoxR family ATPase [bacterium]|nr:MoxR family ATPase [bacterium]